jgi:hypothetical protein
MNQNYSKMIVESGYGYHIGFKFSRLILTFPNACLGVYDYETAHLLHIFQTHGRNAYVVEKMEFSNPDVMQNPKELIIFWATEQVNIYMIDIGDLEKPQSYKNPTKLRLPKGIHAISLKSHPSAPFLYASCNDGLI